MDNSIGNYNNSNLKSGSIGLAADDKSFSFKQNIRRIQMLEFKSVEWFDVGVFSAEQSFNYQNIVKDIMKLFRSDEISKAVILVYQCEKILKEIDEYNDNNKDNNIIAGFAACPEEAQKIKTKKDNKILIIPTNTMNSSSEIKDIISAWFFAKAE